MLSVMVPENIRLPGAADSTAIARRLKISGFMGGQLTSSLLCRLSTDSTMRLVASVSQFVESRCGGYLLRERCFSSGLPINESGYQQRSTTTRQRLKMPALGGPGGPGGLRRHFCSGAAADRDSRDVSYGG